jgi:hypothetical protein
MCASSNAVQVESWAGAHDTSVQSPSSVPRPEIVLEGSLFVAGVLGHADGGPARQPIRSCAGARAESGDQKRTKGRQT